MHESIIVLHCNRRVDFLLPGGVGANSGDRQGRLYKATHQFALTLIGGRICSSDKGYPYADRRVGSVSANRNGRPDICCLQPIFGPIIMTLNLRDIEIEYSVLRTQFRNKPVETWGDTIKPIHYHFPKLIDQVPLVSARSRNRTCNPPRALFRLDHTIEGAISLWRKKPVCLANGILSKV